VQINSLEDLDLEETDENYQPARKLLS